MPLRYISTIAAIVLALPTLHADNLKWLSTEYDFGTIREEAGKAHGRVQFVNLGPEATMIQRVKSTCGCTGVGHTEGLIAPGDTATVWFDYNPAGRPGRFIKHVKAYTGADNDLTSITIKGTVIGAPHSLDTKYPVVADELRLSSDAIPLGKVTYGRARHEYIHGYNQSADTMRLSWNDVPQFISLGASSCDIAPGELFTLSVYVNTRDGVDIGSLDVPIVLGADYGGKHSEATIHVTASIEPDTSGLTGRELADAPSANLFPTILDLGVLPKPGAKTSLEFTVRNEGKTKLDIKRVHCPSLPALITVKSMPKSIKPGEWKKIKIAVDTGKLPSGNFKIPIEVVSNDPLHPARKTNIIGTRP